MSAGIPIEVWMKNRGTSGNKYASKWLNQRKVAFDKEWPLCHNDVLCARGNCYQEYPGNRYFTKHVDQYREVYRNSSPTEKEELIKTIVQEKLREGGSFWTRCDKPNDHLWQIAPFDKVRKKVKYRLEQKDVPSSSSTASPAQEGHSRHSSGTQSITSNQSDRASVSVADAQTPPSVLRCPNGPPSDTPPESSATRTQTQASTQVSPTAMSPSATVPPVAASIRDDPDAASLAQHTRLPCLMDPAPSSTDPNNTFAITNDARAIPSRFIVLDEAKKSSCGGHPTTLEFFRFLEGNIMPMLNSCETEQEKQPAVCCVIRTVTNFAGKIFVRRQRGKGSWRDVSDDEIETFLFDWIDDRLSGRIPSVLSSAPPRLHGAQQRRQLQVIEEKASLSTEHCPSMAAQRAATDHTDAAGDGRWTAPTWFGDKIDQTLGDQSISSSSAMSTSMSSRATASQQPLQNRYAHHGADVESKLSASMTMMSVSSHNGGGAVASGQSHATPAMSTDSRHEARSHSPLSNSHAYFEQHAEPSMDPGGQVQVPQISIGGSDLASVAVSSLGDVSRFEVVGARSMPNGRPVPRDGRSVAHAELVQDADAGPMHGTQVLIQHQQQLQSLMQQMKKLEQHMSSVPPSQSIGERRTSIGDSLASEVSLLADHPPRFIDDTTGRHLGQDTDQQDEHSDGWFDSTGWDPVHDYN